MMDWFDIIIEVLAVGRQLLFLPKPAVSSPTDAACIAKASRFTEGHNGRLANVGENDPFDTTPDFGKCLLTEVAELSRFLIWERQLAARNFL